ncbi:MAG: hypothetical protein V1820_02840 [archaeon]
MAKIAPASFFKAGDFSEGVLAEMKETARFIFEMEGFQEAFATRKGFTKMDLKGIGKILKPEEILLGAPYIENFSFVKKEGEYPGTLIILRDRLIFHTTCAYRLSGATGNGKEGELARMKGEVVAKANSKNLYFEGSLEKFSFTRLADFSKLNTIGFMQDVKSALYGLELKAF